MTQLTLQKFQPLDTYINFSFLYNTFTFAVVAFLSTYVNFRVFALIFISTFDKNVKL